MELLIYLNHFENNLKDKGSEIKLGNDYELAEYIECKIVDEKLSPLAVLGEIRKKGLSFNTSISVNTLYSYIAKGVFARLTIKHLPIKSKKANNVKRSPFPSDRTFYVLKCIKVVALY